MVQFHPHSCTDVTGFALLGHSYEMAQGSGVTIHLRAGAVPYHREALELADMGFIPAGAYRNRQYAQKGVTVKGELPLALEDLFYDPQTSGGLLMAVPEAEAEECLRRLHEKTPAAAIIGYVTEYEENSILLEP